MKKIISTVLCLLILLSCVLPVMAATGVPEEVMESTKSVVRILSKYYNGSATGSGFVIKNEPREVLIATNDHVVSGNPYSISVWVGEDRLVDAEIVFTTSEKDLCVLKVTDTVDMKPLKLSKEDPQHGAAIYVVGYPGAGDILSDTQAHTSDSVTITDGIISAIRSFTIEKGGNPVKLLQVNAAINSGNSGGPLFNTEGVVVGVNTYKVNADSQGVFGSVDISELWSLLDQYGIEIPEEPEVVEAEEEEVTKESSFLMPVLICVGVVCLVLAVILIAKRRKKNTPQRKRKSQKVQTVTLQAHMGKYPQGLGIGGAVSLLLPVAVQLRNLHNDGKLHLQICPENILVGADGASLKEPSSQETGRFNSGFAAPEIYKGAGFGITSDIYSFAAVLLFATTGKVPANSLQQEALDQDLGLLEDMAFAAIIRKAMASNILDRMQSMQEMIYGIAVYNVPVQEKQPHPLRSVETVPVSVGEEKTVPTPLKEEQVEIPKHQKKTVPKKKHRKLLPIAAVLVCGVVAVVLLWKPAAKQDGSMELQSTEQTEITELSEEEIQYQQAEKWEADGQLGRAAIAFGKLGDFSDAQQRSYALWDKFTPRQVLTTGGAVATVLKNDGTIVKTGKASDNDPVLEWTNIIDIVGLRADGTVVTSGFDVSEWKNIVAVIPMGTSYSIVLGDGGRETRLDAYMIGLKSDGTVVAVGDNFGGQCEISGWTDIVAISTGCFGEANATKKFDRKATTQNYYTVGLKYDGTLVTAGQIPENWNPTEWTDIVKISTSGEYMTGLKSDGTVVSTHYDVSDWNDIIDIDAGEHHVLGLRADGTVAAVGNNHLYHHLEVDDWSDIVSINASNKHTVGLKSDGTVIAVGNKSDGKCDVSDWKDIVAIDTTANHTIGWRSDGTAVIVGWKANEYFDISGITDIKIPAKLLPARNGNETKTEESPTDQQAQYDAAEKLLADGETAKAAIAFGKLGDYKDARERSFALWDEVAVRDTVAVGNHHTLGLKNDGTVVVAGKNIRHVGSAHRREVFPMPQGQGQCDVGDWSDIIAVAADGTCSVGLKRDGTVIGTGLLSVDDSDAVWKKVESWQDVVSIAVSNGCVMGLKLDGTVVCTNQDLSEWSDVVAISSGAATVGLKVDGSVLAVGNNYNGTCNVEQWTDIVALYAGNNCTIGLKTDGTVVAAGDNSDGQCSVEDWTDIKSVSGSGWETYRTYGIKDDGTVLCAGKQSSWYNASKWKDIVCIAAGRNHAVGLKYDGTLVATGNTEFGRCDVSGWTDIKLPN